MLQLFINKKTRLAIALFSFLGLAACHNKGCIKQTDKQVNWRENFPAQLSILGHRNWILVVDKAFPLQTASGTEVINTNEDLLPVLKEVMQDISASTHVKPIIYTDRELNYITPSLIGNINSFKDSLKVELANRPVQTMLHDSVFVKIAEASKLFKILVLKTNQTIPYSSVFIQLDCAYWNSEKEKALRDSIKKSGLR